MLKSMALLLASISPSVDPLPSLSRIRLRGQELLEQLSIVVSQTSAFFLPLGLGVPGGLRGLFPSAVGQHTTSSEVYPLPSEGDDRGYGGVSGISLLELGCVGVIFSERDP
jgi:hypothetical protein